MQSRKVSSKPLLKMLSGSLIPEGQRPRGTVASTNINKARKVNVTISLNTWSIYCVLTLFIAQGSILTLAVICNTMLMKGGRDYIKWKECS